MSVFAKITAQQPKERNAVWMVGEQLKDILRYEPLNQEIVELDLDIPNMILSECEKKIKQYADKHREGNSSCVTPAAAEEIIRSFYGLRAEAPTAPAAAPRGKLLDLKDFL